MPDYLLLISEWTHGLGRKLLLSCAKPKVESVFDDIPNIDVEKAKLRKVEKSRRKLGHRDSAYPSTKKMQNKEEEKDFLQRNYLRITLGKERM